MSLTKISTGGVKDDAASQAKIADEAIDEARLQVSNAGTNGQFLQKQTGNAGGLTWSDVPAQYTHPNHSGEVTSTGDGATVIADNIVDEANLKVSNTPTNGQFLSAQSGNTGGLTWADVTIPPSGNSVDLSASGAIAAGKPVIIKTNGKAEQVKTSFTQKSTVTYNTRYIVEQDTSLNEVQTVWVEQHRLLFAIYKSGNGYLKSRCFKFDTNWNSTAGSVQTLASNTTSAIQATYDPVQDRLVIAMIVLRSGNYHLEIMAGVPSAGSIEIQNLTNPINNQIEVGSGNTSESLAMFYETTSQKHVLIYRKNPSGGSSGANWDTYSRVISLSGSTFTINSATTLDSDDMTEVDICRVDSNKIAVSMRMNSGSSGTGYARIGTIGSTTMTWGSRVDFTGGGSAVVGYNPERATSIVYDVNNSKLFIGWTHMSNNRAYSVVGSVSGTTISMDTSTWLDINGGQNGDSEAWMRLVRDPSAGGIYTYFKKSNGQVYAAKVTYDNSAAAKSTLGSLTNLSADGTLTYQESNKNISAASEGKVFLAASDTGSSIRFNVRSTNVADLGTNVTDRNVIGFANSAISDGATGTINIQGSIATGLSGLTPATIYYVQDDGTLGTNVVSTQASVLALASDKGMIQTRVR